MANKRKTDSWWSRNGSIVITAVLTAAVTSPLTLFVTDFSDFRSSQRELVAQEQRNVETTTKQVNSLIQKFADRALGMGEVSTTDRAQLNELLLRLSAEARTLSQRLPSTEPIYVEFTDAMIALKNTAADMTGPADAKPFVQAVANYYEYQFKFNEAVVTAQQRYKAPSI